MIVRAYLNSLLSLVKSGLIYCAAARHVDGAKKWDGKQAVDTPSSTNTSLFPTQKFRAGTPSVP